MNDSEQLVTVIRGDVREEELAALTVVLWARAVSGPPATTRHRPGDSAPWRRLERQQRFHAPHSWQA